MRIINKIGAIFYGLWGLVHILGGVSLLTAVQSGGAEGLLMNFIAGGTVNSAAAVSIFAYHAYNLTWIGALVLVIAVFFNWCHSSMGYWLNMALAGLVDLGLVVFMVLPGTIALAEAMIGISLFVAALVLTTAARMRTRELALQSETH